MNSLTRQLRGLQKYVLTGDATGVAGVVGTRGFTRAQRLNVYREGYYLRLGEALAETFPVLRMVLGDDDFRVLVRRYVDAHPSHHFSVRRYGHRLAHWLDNVAPFSRRPVLAELAEWEWAMAHAFDAADQKPIQLEALSRISSERWPDVRLEFHAALCQVPSRWNTVAIWRALTRGEAPPEFSCNNSIEQWSIWRQGLRIFFDRLGDPERRALSLARRGRNFSQICMAAPPTVDVQSKAQWSASLLRRWVDRGWIVRLISD
jgi:hypothetical protein